MYRTHNQRYDWLDLRSHRLFEFHVLNFHFESSKYGPAYNRRGLLVSMLYWRHGKPVVEHFVDGHANYRIFNTDSEVDVKYMKDEHLAKVKASFEDSLSLEEYLSKTETALLQAAEDFEMSLLEGDPFPEPKEMQGYDSDDCYVRVGLWEKESLL